MADHTPTLVELEFTSLEDPGLHTATVRWVIGDGTVAGFDVDLTVGPQPACFEIERHVLDYTPTWENCPQCTEHAVAGALRVFWRFGDVVEGVPACG